MVCISCKKEGCALSTVDVDDFYYVHSITRWLGRMTTVGDNSHYFGDLTKCLTSSVSKLLACHVFMMNSIDLKCRDGIQTFFFGRLHPGISNKKGHVFA